MSPRIFLNAALADTNQFWDVFMLKKWTTHSDYLSHLNREIDSLSLMRKTGCSIKSRSILKSRLIYNYEMPECVLKVNLGNNVS